MRSFAAVDIDVGRRVPVPDDGVLALREPAERRRLQVRGRPQYVVHLVADVHQPLHAGFADDRGGNRFQVQAYGRGTNLHALWDSALVEHWRGGPVALRAAVESQAAAGDATTAPAKWAEESCTIMSANGFYPARHRIDEDYAERWRRTLVSQLAKASARLAAVLNQALSGQ